MMSRARLARVVAVLVAIVAAMTVTAGCDAEVSTEIGSCRDYRAMTKFGRFTVQQASKGSAIQWGAYPNARYDGDEYRVTVRIDGQKIDSKNQDYAAHGSVGKARARKHSGKIFEVKGAVRNNGKLVLDFTMRCRVL